MERKTHMFRFFREMLFFFTVASPDDGMERGKVKAHHEVRGWDSEEENPDEK